MAVRIEIRSNPQALRDLTIEKIAALRSSHRASWMRYNKPFGWEALDIRYGGIYARMESTKERINDYLSGNICYSCFPLFSFNIIILYRTGIKSTSL